jgi:hypothetical protein
MTFKTPLRRLAGLVGMAFLTLPAARALGQDAAPAVSQDKSLDVQLFQPAIGPRNFLTVDGAEVARHKQAAFGLMLNYQDRPYVLSTKGAMPSSTNVVESQAVANLSAAVGLFDRLQLGLDLPFTAVVRGDVVDLSGMPTGDKLDTSGLGDLRIELKALLATLGDDDQVSFGAIGGITAPTGKETAYLGDKTVTGRIKAIGGWQSGPARAGVNLGLLLRETSYSFKTDLGDELLYGAAFSYEFPRHLQAIAEVAGRSGLREFSKFYKDVNPIEFDLAARLGLSGMWSLTAGGGAGLGNGIGAPRFRAFLGAMFTPDFRDRDHDGVPDVNDKCPDQPEDRDGFEDSDGCPDPDNDGDKILDAQDKCPNDPEDYDQFQDEDGCPELDNDRDGIPDINDACPNAPEDGKGARPKDGCPSTAEDADGDGIPDARDKCPDEPEDKDGFQDEDGCPDPDNDGDGIPDSFDNCPNQAEDNDGFEDEDGCPDPDNDHDGFPDAQDKCPNQAETLNGIQDDDGCPDPGAEIVHLKPSHIELDERLVFQSRGAQASSLKESSVAAAGTVALLLRAHPEVKKVRIQLQAPGLSSQETQRRADIVRDTLVSKGIDFGRLSSVGLGAGPARLDFIIESQEAPPASAPSKTTPKAAAGKPPTGTP